VRDVARAVALERGAVAVAAQPSVSTISRCSGEAKSAR
jgi:hypothetical protein